MTRLSFAWDPEEFSGVGAAQQAACTVPHCGLPVDSRGLCFACYMAWRRKGLAGLEARAQRVLFGVRLQVPMDLDKAVGMLVDTYEQWTDAEGTTYDALRSRIINICKAIGTIDRRKKWARYTRTWREKHGQARGAEGRGQKGLRPSVKLIVSAVERSNPPTTEATHGEHRSVPGGQQGDQRHGREAGFDPGRGGGVHDREGPPEVERRAQVHEDPRRAEEGEGEGPQGGEGQGSARPQGEGGQEGGDARVEKIGGARMPATRNSKHEARTPKHKAE